MPTTLQAERFTSRSEGNASRDCTRAARGCACGHEGQRQRAQRRHGPEGAGAEAPIEQSRHEDQRGRRIAACLVVPRAGRQHVVSRLVVAAAIVQAVEALDLASLKIDAKSKTELAVARATRARET